jgi:hypothetical protein
MAAGVVHVPWYATLFRGDELAEALAEVAPTALRYGASDFQVERSKEDSYRFIQHAAFESKVDFEAWWYGPEMVDFRTRYSSYYQVPVVYEWWGRLASGAIPSADGEAAEQAI